MAKSANGKIHLPPTAAEPGQRVYVRPARPRTPRIALVGFCSPHREYVPYDDKDLTVAGLNRGYVFMPRADIWYEMHGPNIYRWEARRPKEHIPWLKAFPGPIYQHVADPEIPNSIAYPLAEVAADLGVNSFRLMADKTLKPLTEVPYFSSSIAYQIALAIYERYEQIELYGIDLNTGGEYAWQKPGVEWLLGIAAARGIKVVVPDECALLKGKLYGRGFMKPEGEALSKTQLETRRDEMQEKLQKLAAQMHQVVGAKTEAAFILGQMVPGLDHEKLSRRVAELTQLAVNLEAQVQQIQGGLSEDNYWISFTPDGQEGDQALAQLQQLAPPRPAEQTEPEPVPVEA